LLTYCCELPECCTSSTRLVSVSKKISCCCCKACPYNIILVCDSTKHMVLHTEGALTTESHEGGFIKQNPASSKGSVPVQPLLHHICPGMQAKRPILYYGEQCPTTSVPDTIYVWQPACSAHTGCPRSVAKQNPCTASGQRLHSVLTSKQHIVTGSISGCYLALCVSRHQPARSHVCAALVTLAESVVYLGWLRHTFHTKTSGGPTSRMCQRDQQEESLPVRPPELVEAPWSSVPENVQVCLYMHLSRTRERLSLDGVCPRCLFPLRTQIPTQGGMQGRLKIRACGCAGFAVRVATEPY